MIINPYGKLYYFGQWSLSEAYFPASLTLSLAGDLLGQCKVSEVTYITSDLGFNIHALFVYHVGTPALHHEKDMLQRAAAPAT